MTDSSITSQKQRIEYLDIAKGLMIVLLFFHHYPQALTQNNIECANIPVITCWHEWFLVFFMQGFFLVSGYCSNFDKSIKVFLSSNIKQLIIPAILFGLIFSTEKFIGVDSLSGFYQLITTLPYWFLWVLFGCKLICRCIRTIHDYLQVLLLVCLVGVGFWLKFADCDNPFYVQNICVSAFFVCIGAKLRKYKTLYEKYENKAMFATIVSFIASMCILIHFVLPRPIITGMLVVGGMKEYPLFIFLATTGSISLIAISKFINQCKLLQLLGMYSLILYCLQEKALYYSAELVNSTIGLSGNGLCIDIFLQLLVIAMSITICTMVAYVFNRYKYFKVLTGKW